MLVKVYGSAVFGIEATTITVEVNIDKRSLFIDINLSRNSG
ncbi:MAG: hypothetical protein ABJH82_12555 [Polaribacter sp.]